MNRNLDSARAMLVSTQMHTARQFSEARYHVCVQVEVKRDVARPHLLNQIVCLVIVALRKAQAHESDCNDLYAISRLR
jgi:hypothetical protein